MISVMVVMWRLMTDPGCHCLECLLYIYALNSECANAMYFKKIKHYELQINRTQHNEASNNTQQARLPPL